MINIPAEWELVKSLPAVEQCRKCGQCSGQGGHCAAKMGPPPTPEQEAFIRSFVTPVSIDQVRPWASFPHNPTTER